MAPINSFRSWLSGHGRNADKIEPEVEPESREAPERDPTLLKLKPEHPLMELWTRFGSGYPEPCLRLDVPMEAAEDDVEGELSELVNHETVGQELGRLERQSAFVAKRRMELMDAGGTDAYVQLFITTRHMTAWLLIYPPRGGSEVTADMLNDALKRGQVVYGIDDRLLGALPAMRNRYFTLFLVARGDAALNGRDGYIIDMFSRNPVNTLMEDEDGQIDYASQATFQNAKRGDVICEMVPPTACRDGRTVLGDISYARAGKQVFLPRGRNTEISEDGTRLIASCDGHVEFSGRSFQVKPVMDIDGNVDVSTGNLNCLGDIHVHGDILGGLTVRATGTITVDGVIEASTVEAGGDLVVRKGVQGSGQAVLRSHRSVFAKYLESSNVYAKENLQADCIVNCEVYSDGSVTARSGRGAIIGGVVRAAKQVSANIVGARSEQHTGVTLGGRPFEMFERDELVRGIEQLEAELGKIAKQAESADRDIQASKKRVQISAYRLRLKQYDKIVSEEEPVSGGRLVCGCVYPGTEITIGDASLKVTRQTSACTAYMRDGEVVLE